MAQFNRLAACAGMAAALSMAVSPAAAAETPASVANVHSAHAAPAVFDAEALNATHHRWRYRGHRYRHRVDAGDVLAGVLIIGGIAAIASAASKSERDRRYRERDVRYRDTRDSDRYRRDSRRSSSGRGIDGAVDMCLAEIERDVRVDSVDSVDRSGEGWRVSGTIFNGDRFTCVIGADGRIDTVDYGGGFASVAPATGRQHSDARYRAAWATLDRDGLPEPGNASEAAQDEPDESAEPLPAYPGGPIDGDIDSDAPDDRYTMAQAAPR